MKLDEMKLFVTTIYTLRGKRLSYSLGDMAYGQWLVFKDDHPHFYINIFEYKGDNMKFKETENLETYLEQKLKVIDSHLSLKQNIIGLRSSKTYSQWFKLEKLSINNLI